MKRRVSFIKAPAIEKDFYNTGHLPMQILSDEVKFASFFTE